MAFIEWMIMQGRLPIKERLMTWGVSADDGCCLCSMDQESHDHLFFDHLFLLRLVLYKAENKNWWCSNESGGTFTWANQVVKGKPLKSANIRLALAATIYHIWCQVCEKLQNFSAQGSKC